MATATFTGFGFSLVGGGGILHSCRVMSSNAKSLPHPPGPLVSTFSTSVPVLAGVVKRAVYWIQEAPPAGGISPVENLASSCPPNVEMMKRTLGRMGVQ